MPDKKMLINVVEGEEVRIAVVQNGRLEELYMERASAESHVGNIYKGRVVNVEPSIQAAFIDFGQGKNGFLHISDLQPQYFPGQPQKEEVGKKTSRRDRPPIQRCLKRGQEIIVQVTKEGIGTKGPTLTTYISIPGRFLVLMPGMSRLGVSRKIEDEEARRVVRKQLDELSPPKNMGFIVRTAGVGQSKRELQRDLNYLVRLWKTVAERIKNEKAPAELYQESDLVTRTIRDVFNSDIKRFVVDNETVCKRVSEFLNIALPRGRKQPVEHYTDPVPLFHRYNIEQELERVNSRHVPLSTGGSLVIDQTEALVAIDVNSGRYRSNDDAEKTAFKTDMEAAVEVARQLRLRDLGGVIIIDFIDLRDSRHQREVERTLREAVKNDRARSEILKMSRFGIVEMTRQRMRPSLERSLYEDCPHCRGAGLIKTPESLSFDVMRTIQAALSREEVDRIEVTVSPSAGQFLHNRKRRALVQIEDGSGKRVVINIDENLGQDEVRYNCIDRRGLAIAMDLLVRPTEPARPRQAPPAEREPHAHEPSHLRDDLEDVEPSPNEPAAGPEPQIARSSQPAEPPAAGASQAPQDDQHDSPDDSPPQPQPEAAAQPEAGAQDPAKKRRSRRPRRRRSKHQQHAQESPQQSSQAEQQHSDVPPPADNGMD